MAEQEATGRDGEMSAVRGRDDSCLVEQVMVSQCCRTGEGTRDVCLIALTVEDVVPRASSLLLFICSKSPHEAVR